MTVDGNAPEAGARDVSSSAYRDTVNFVIGELASFTLEADEDECASRLIEGVLERLRRS